MSKHTQITLVQPHIDDLKTQDQKKINETLTAFIMNFSSETTMITYEFAVREFLTFVIPRVGDLKNLNRNHVVEFKKTFRHQFTL